MQKPATAAFYRVQGGLGGGTPPNPEKVYATKGVFGLKMGILPKIPILAENTLTTHRFFRVCVDLHEMCTFVLIYVV